jgi:Ca2+-binding RTX toxin-like protein
MKVSRVSRSHAVVVAALGVALLPRVASAQTCAAPADCPATTEPPTRPKAATVALRVRVDAHGFPFDRAKLRASLAQDLQRPVVLAEGSADVSVDLQSATHAQVSYTNPSQATFQSGIDLPPDRERSVQVVSWLVVNLVRDEASELLNELRARRLEETELRAAADKAAADKAAADKAAATEKALADAAKADKAAADKAAAEAARKRAKQAAKPPLVPDDLLRDPLRSYDAAVATPLSLLRDSPKRELRLQLALGYGESGAIQGIGVSLGVLRIRRELQGVAAGVGVAVVGRRARYAQVDGILEGALVGAGAAVQRGPFMRGVVVAVGGAMANDVTGVMVGGGFSTARSLRGLALSGGATIIRGPSEGVLLGAGANSSSQHRGIEISGGANVARDLEGVAIAPVNVHRRVKGIQFGVVNVAEQVDGAAIGVISFAKNGRVQPVLWTGGLDGSAHVAIKSLAGYVFTELGSGIDLNDDQFSYDGGIGLHLKLGKYFFLEPSVHYSATHGLVDASGAPDAQRVHYLAQLGFRVSNKLDLLAGGGVRQTVAGGTGAAIAPELRAGIAFF